MPTRRRLSSVHFGRGRPLRHIGRVFIQPSNSNVIFNNAETMSQMESSSPLSFELANRAQDRQISPPRAALMDIPPDLDASQQLSDEDEGLDSRSANLALQWSSSNSPLADLPWNEPHTIKIDKSLIPCKYVFLPEG